MKSSSALISFVCFGLAFAATLAWKPLRQPSAVAPSGAASSHASAAPHLPGPHPGASSAAFVATAPSPALPYEKQTEERLLALCRDLASSDPEAAFRAGMACWGFDKWAMSIAAEALVKKNPSVARRLLADCPDLRSRSILECELMADEVRRDPKEKLLWADANLSGYVKIKALNAGISALAKMDAAAALDLVANWPPSLMKLNGQLEGLSYRLKEDPAAAIAWAAENLPPNDRGMVGAVSIMRFLKNNPGQGMPLLPQLPLEYQQHLGFAMAHASKNDPTQSLPQMMKTIRSLPGEIQTSVIRSMAMNFQNGPVGKEKTPVKFLESLTAPDERAAVIEAMVVESLSSFKDSEEPSKILDSLSQFQTPADKQSAARVVPYLMDLTEAQRGEILGRLN